MMSMRPLAGLFAIALLSGAVTACTTDMRGVLVFGHEARSLQPCGHARVFWVHVPDALVREQLKGEYRRLVKRPYEPVYVELEGRYADQPSAGFAADYDGTIEVRELHSMSREGVEACRVREPAAAP
jgi:putative lipoprotein